MSIGKTAEQLRRDNMNLREDLQRKEREYNLLLLRCEAVESKAKTLEEQCKNIITRLCAVEKERDNAEFMLASATDLANSAAREYSNARAGRKGWGVMVIGPVYIADVVNQLTEWKQRALAAGKERDQLKAALNKEAPTMAQTLALRLETERLSVKLDTARLDAAREQMEKDCAAMCAICISPPNYGCKPAILDDDLGWIHPRTKWSSGERHRTCAASPIRVVWQKEHP